MTLYALPPTLHRFSCAGRQNTVSKYGTASSTRGQPIRPHRTLARDDNPPSDSPVSGTLDTMRLPGHTAFASRNGVLVWETLVNEEGNKWRDRSGSSLNRSSISGSDHPTRT